MQSAAYAQMPPYLPGTVFFPLSSTGTTGKNGDDAKCPSYKPSDGHTGATPDLIPSATSAINLTSVSSPTYGTGVVLQSTGGAGGTGGNGFGCYSGYGGGDGGDGGPITFTNGQSVTSPLSPSLNLTGTGMMAVSQGGKGGTGGGTGTTLSAGNGGHGGSGGTVSLSNFGSITTSGQYAFGMYGVSVGGGGGAGGVNKSAISGQGGDGMAGGVGGSVSLTNSGTISTANAYAMYGVSMGGYGGSTGQNGGIFASPTPTSGYGGSGGDVTLQNLNTGQSTTIAQLTTNGPGQAAMMALSVGGGGGDAGRATGIGQYGANGGPGASGGTVTTFNSGLIQTMSSASMGMAAVSVGGGGGAGGSAQDALFGGGGNGGGGGDGGSIFATNTDSIYTGGGTGATTAMTTGGGVAPAMAAVSAGGGGGLGGSVIGGGVGFSLSLGGKGGDGGKGGTILINNSNILQTTEVTSAGIVAASVGGGGGVGGGAFAASVGSSTVSIAIGGNGGSGGDAGMIGINCGQANSSSASSAPCANSTVATSASAGSKINTLGDISPGIAAFSVGGGGGHAGYGLSLAAGTNMAAAISIGGTGGDGGAGSDIYVGTNGVPIQTAGDLSAGLVALSAGGGGGHGGVTMYTPDYVPGGAVATTSVSINVGGSGGGSGAGGTVTAENIGAAITTLGDRAAGMFAGSVGGHGGHGGLASGGALGLNTAASVSVGGKGGNGNDAGAVTVNNNATILTFGADSHGIEALAVGGGGGSGGWSAGAGVSLGGNATSFTIGGTGGSGGNGGAVTVNNSGAISLTGLGAAGILGLSVGGGGGNGGSSASSDVSLNGVFTETVGGFGTGGATAGPVTITNSGNIATGLSFVSNPSTPALGAQGMVGISVGGGGGRGGVSVSGDVNASTDGSTQSLIETIGGGSGGGGNGGAVSLTNTGKVATFGDLSNALLAMSLGGRGGLGGIAVGGSVSLQNTTNITLGSDGGNGGKGGNASVNNAGVIETAGFRAIGVSSQSLGGHGGMGGISVGATIASENSGGAAITLGGTGGKGGVAGTAIVTHQSGASVTTTGPFSAGLVAQSIGGDGGIGGIGLGVSTTTKAPSMSLGGSGGAAALGGTASIVSAGSVTSSGNNSVGILAQSIGGNGGLSGATIAGGSSDRAGNFNNQLGSQGGNGSTGGTASVSVSGPVSTTGLLSTGIAVESIGGGGGRAGTAMTLDTGNPNNLQPFGAVANIGATGGGGGNGGTANLTVTGSVATSGPLSEALYAGSIGGGGGSAGLGFFNFTSGSKSFDMSVGGQGGSDGIGGAVTVYANNSLAAAASTTISAAQEYSHGIFAQSIGGGGGSATGIHKQASAAGGFAGLMRLGSTGDSGGAGGSVNLYTGGAVQTGGIGSTGILGQSIGGGGGQTVSSLIAATTDISIPGTDIQFIIGSGAAANPNGSSGTSTSVPSTSISLTSFSQTTLTAGSASSSSLGGFSSSPGNGGDVTITSGSTISTNAAMSDGIKMQSIGGGGGISAFGDVLSGSPFAASTMFLGGGESGGGVGGSVTVTNNAGITTNGGLSIGIFAQSLGGGGGDARHTSTANVGVASAFVVGQGLQSGGKGGSAGIVNVTNNGQIVTTGQGSDGILAQAIGGAGGFSALSGSAANAAGYSSSTTGVNGSSQSGVTSNAYSVDSSTSASFAGKSGSNSKAGGAVSTVSGASMAAVLGASGGSINNAGNAVSLINNGTVQTAGDAAAALIGQSIGAGGGIATQSSTNFDQSQTSLSLMLGALEAAYGEGSTVTINHGSANSTTTQGLQTTGHASTGILAQSIGGGGGLGILTASTVGQGGTASFSTALGGSGSTYGVSGSVTVNSIRPVSTTGDLSQGILAQSISNGGGAAKAVVYSEVAAPKTTSTLGYANSTNLTVSSSAGTGLAAAALLGASSQTGSSAGAVSVNSSASITTSGVRSGAILAQSIGGGGGVTDMSTNRLNSGNFFASANLGGSVGAAGSNVIVQTSGPIITTGALSDGILAQSISGGGGSFGVSDAGITPVSTGTLSYLLGSSNLTGNQTNQSTVSVTAQQSISTSGFGSTGITAQAIGGGGGLVGYMYATDFASKMGASGFLGMNAASQSNGYSVSVQSSASITTSGPYASGIVAQSIGGGGGRVVGNQGTSTGYAARLGSNAGGGDGGNVNLNVSGAITTNGLYANGIVAQSIGAGGGILDYLVNSMTFGANPTAAGSGGSVNVTQSGPITTNATGIGILAMSVGGGGGLATVAGGQSLSVGSGVLNTSNGGAVTVNVNAPIFTKGTASPGVLAVSIGGGGGVVTDTDESHTQFANLAGLGSGGNVIVNVNSNIKTSGMGSDGVDAISIGGGGLVFLSNDYPIPVSAFGKGNAGTVSINVAPNVTIQTQGPTSQAITAIQMNGNADPEVNIGKGALVEGGSSGVGVRFAGAINTLNNEGTIQTAGAVGGRAIVSDVGLTTLNNRGFINGAIHLNGSGNIVNNYQGGHILTSNLDLGTDSLLTSAGFVQFRSAQAGSMGIFNISGTFNQQSTGVLGIDLDFYSGKMGTLVLAPGSRMNLSGDVYPEITANAGRIAPGSKQFTLIQRNDGTLNVDQLNVLSTAIMNYGLINRSDGLILNATADFAPSGISSFATQVGRAIGEYQTMGSNPFFQSATSRLVRIPSVGLLDQNYVGLAGTSISTVPKVTYEAVGRAVDTVSDRLNTWRVGGGVAAPSANAQALMSAQGFSSSVMGTPMGFDAVDTYRNENGNPASGANVIRTWITPFQVDASSNVLSNKLYGGTLGIDTESNDRRFLAGAGFTISQSNYTYDNFPTPRTPGSATNYGLSLYFGARHESAYISAIGYVGGGQSRLARQLQVLGFNDSTNLKVNNLTLAARFEAGYNFLLNPQSQNPIQLTPFAAIQPTQIRQQSLNESFSSLGSGFNYSAKTNTAIPIFLGAELSGTFALGEKETLRPFLRASWIKDTMNSGDMGASFSATDGVSIFSSGTPSNGNAWSIKAGVKYNNGDRASVYATLDAVKGLNSSNYKGIGGTVGVVYRW